MDIFKALDEVAEMLSRLQREEQGTLVSVCYRTQEGDDVAVGYVEDVSSVVRLKLKDSYIEIPKRDVVDYNVVKSEK